MSALERAPARPAPIPQRKVMKEFTLSEIAQLTGSKLIGSPAHLIRGVSDLENASLEDISFLANPHYQKAMENSSAGAVFIAPAIPLPADRNFLVTENPSEAFQTIVKAFYSHRQAPSCYRGIHPTAIIPPSATIGENVTIGPYTVIDSHATIGDNTTISASCSIGAYVTIGADCVIHPHVILREFSHLGNRVILQPGVVIGSCGFGYLQNKSGEHTKLEQLGYVEIGDDVEIGANTTIDRARFKKTSVGRGTKIDNLVQIAHGVQIGEHSLVIAQTGIAGSTCIGNHVILAGQVAVAGHLEIADGVMVAGRGGVSKSIQKPGKYGGIPAIPLSEHHRNTVHLRNVGSLVAKIHKLEAKLSQLIDAKPKHNTP